MVQVNNLIDLVGHTPLLKLNENYPANIYAKLEFFNPGSSVKDRISLALIKDAEQRGLLQKDSVIIEPTSGNTGVGLAWVSAILGYKVMLVMPDTMSIERRKLLAHLGAEIVLTEGAQGMSGAVAKAKELTASISNAYMPDQFANEANAKVHEDTTAQEIYHDMQGKIDVFVAGVGTGGTLTGVGRFLKTHCKDVRIIAVEPSDSAVLSGKKAGPHKIQGIGAGFVPEVLDTKIFDEVIQVQNTEAIDTARYLARKHGLLVGISSGAAAFATFQVAQRPEFARCNIVTVLPDTAERYISTILFADTQ